MSDELNVITWRWGKYPAHFVERLRAGLSRHLKQEFKFCVFAPEQEDEYLTEIPGCFCRLRTFSPQWQQKHALSGRIVSIDLDTVITGPLDPLFDRPESFVIMQGANAANPCPYNGALQLLRAGTHRDVWDDFSVTAAEKIPFHSFPDDQGWLAHKIPDAAGWQVGPQHGIYVYQKPGWPGGKSNEELPAHARLVTFINKTPQEVAHLAWVKRHWTT